MITADDGGPQTARDGSIGDAAVACAFDPSTYGNSCRVDSDCVAVPQGDVCTNPCERACPTGAINAAVSNRYISSVNARTAGLGTVGVCHCPALAAAPCCRGETCSNSASICSTTPDASAGDAAPEADATAPESGSGDTADGSDGNQAPPSDAFVSATLGPHRDSDGNNLCAFATPNEVLAIGTPAVGGPITVIDGGSQSGATVTLLCSVKAGFQVTLQAGLGGQAGGTLVISGNTDASNGGSGISGDIVSSNGEFSESDCTIAYRYQGQPVPTMPFIAPGRIWAHLSCPAMVNQSGTLAKLMDGGTTQETCDAEVDFLFENCSQ